MPNMRYGLPSEELLHSLTPTVVAGTPDPTYGVVNLVNGLPALPAKFTTTFVTLQWDLGSAQLPAWLQLTHTNLTSGTVQWQTNTASDFSGAGETYPATIPPTDADGYVDDLIVVPATPIARRYLRLFITGNAANVILGEAWVSTAVHSLVHDPAKGVQRPERRLSVQLTTLAGVVLSYDLGMREEATRQLVVTTRRSDGESAIRTWYRTTRGASRPFPLLDSLTGRAQLVRWDQQGVTKAAPQPSAKAVNELAPATTSPTWVKLTLGFVHVSRGLPWISTP